MTASDGWKPRRNASSVVWRGEGRVVRGKMMGTWWYKMYKPRRSGEEAYFETGVKKYGNVSACHFMSIAILLSESYRKEP